MLTDLAQVPYEPEEGEPDFESLWDNDMDALILEEEDAKGNVGGDEDATITGGDADAAVSGGDGDASIQGGDEDATITGGDEDATVTGGDEDAPVNDHDLSKLP